MSTGYIVAAAVLLVAVLVAIEVHWSRQKRQYQQRLDDEWRTTEATIRRDVLAMPGRQQVIEDVKLRAQSNNAQLQQLCQSTATALMAPAAVITVVEREGQRWLAYYGAEWCAPDALAGMLHPLEQSYCQYVVAKDEPLVITDSLKDIRIRTADTDTRQAVRAYIGAPVHASDGTPFGSLCVFDSHPRNWNTRDLATVKAFAALVSL